MDYSELVQFLTELEQRGSRYGVDNTRAILEKMLESRARPVTVQVAGTNGKGSTAFFLEYLLLAGGYSVGTFTSPHLHDVRERIRVNGRMIEPPEMVESYLGVRGVVDVLLASGDIAEAPTYFEWTFLMAYEYFLHRGVQAAILEVGLGGRLDATTAAERDVCVITGIALDHAALLGATTEAIAAEKAGVAKRGVPLVCGCGVESPEFRVIEAVANAAGATAHPALDGHNQLFITDTPEGYSCRYLTEQRNYAFLVTMNGRHQPRNAALALRTLELLEPLGIRLSDEAARHGASQCRVPGRLEFFPGPPPIYLDCSHNPESIEALAVYLQGLPAERFTLIFGVLADKDYRSMVKILAPLAERVYLAAPDSPRALPPEELAPVFTALGVSDVRIVGDALHALELARRDGGAIVITGSFYLSGLLRRAICHGG